MPPPLHGSPESDVLQPRNSIRQTRYSRLLPCFLPRLLRCFFSRWNPRMRTDKSSGGSPPFVLKRSQPLVRFVICIALANGSVRGTGVRAAESDPASQATAVRREFNRTVKPLLQTYCVDCHSVDHMESGIRVDHLDGRLSERTLRLWEAIRRNVSESTMPPEDADSPAATERQAMIAWIDRGLTMVRSRPDEKNGSTRRLTVRQYQNTLHDLLGIDENLTDILPPDAVSEDGFVNNSRTLELSPLLLEACFTIADRALDFCIVDPETPPRIQNFRMELGDHINPDPCPDKLILGALSRLLDNDDFVVTQLTASKPYDFEPFFMRTRYRFIEGYQGNATVRGWREYDSIYHAVFACMRGNPGYPKGNAYDVIPDGLLLRPAIPSAELFQVESTYGPKANFKISLRELPDTGPFRVTVRAARYDDGLLLDPGTLPAAADSSTPAVTAVMKDGPQTVAIHAPGIYQVDVTLRNLISEPPRPDASRLSEGRIAHWSFDGTPAGRSDDGLISGELTGGARSVPSPFGQSIALDGKQSAVVAPRSDRMNVGEGDFTVAAWIHPTQLRQAGIVCLGRYNYTHGWYLDMPNGSGVLRIETINANSQLNGTVQSRRGVIRRNQWQHVAAVVRRGDNATRLYVNGFEVGRGTIHAASLDNPKTSLHIGRIENGSLFQGQIDEVHLYHRALDLPELQALIEPGRRFAKPPPEEPRRHLSLTLGQRHFSGQLSQDAFLTLRLQRGPLSVAAQYEGQAPVDTVTLTRLAEDSRVAQDFASFERRSPRLGVHLGLRRDCGSTLNPVGPPQTVRHTELQAFTFQGAISNFPSPNVEADNVNYLAGIREIGVRSEYTDGRDRPRLLIRSVEFEGPSYDTWPPASHRRIFFESENQDAPELYAREIIARFARRAFRRPVHDRELTSLMSVFTDSFTRTSDFHRSVKDVLLTVLTSPQFLFLIETSQSPKPEPIDDFELASKLSYFLWNTAPDQELLDLASSSLLRQTIDAQIDRMIDSPRFHEFADQFVSQWLNLDRFDVLEADRELFPRLTRDTRFHLRQEPVHFLKHAIRRNLPLRSLIDSDHIVANEVVAAYYGLGPQTESGFDFVPILHSRKHLGGLLTQAAILAGLSDGRHSNPVKRGAWFARRIIAEPPAPPPPNVPALPEDGESHMTLREKLERHRQQKGCLKCHEGIDPWGIPFEEFDAGGLFRRVEPDAVFTALPDRSEVRGVGELKQYLIHQRLDQVAFSVLKHLAIYATGRSLTWNEIEFLKGEGVRLRETGYRMRDLIRLVVHSPLFLEK